MPKAWIPAALAVGMQTMAVNQIAHAQPRDRASSLLTAARSLRLTAKAQRAVVPVGKPVVLSLMLKNTGRQPFNLTDDAEPSVNFLLLATRKDGRKVSLTEYGSYAARGGFTKLASGEGFRNHKSEFATLKPGRGKQYVLPASKIYDMRRKGTYVLTVIRQFVLSETLTLIAKNKSERTWELDTQNGAVPASDKSKAVRLVSNTVTVTVQ